VSRIAKQCRIDLRAILDAQPLDESVAERAAVEYERAVRWALGQLAR